MPPDISIIIPAHNEAERLPALLNDIAKQSTAAGSIEVIVVADACTDNTVTLARRHPVRPQVSEVSFRNLVLTRNRGAELAHGRTFLFIDADQRLTQTTFLKTVAHFEQPRSIPYFGTTHAIPQENHLFAHFILAVRSFLIAYRLVSVANGSLIITASLFHHIGGFRQEALTFELHGIIQRALEVPGTQFLYLSHATVAISMRRYEQEGYWNVLWSWAKRAVRLILKLEQPVYLPASDLEKTQ